MGLHFVYNPLLAISKIRGLKSARSASVITAHRKRLFFSFASRLLVDLSVETCAHLNVRLRVVRYFPQGQLIERNTRGRMKTTPREKKRVRPSALVAIFYFARSTIPVELEGPVRT